MAPQRHHTRADGRYSPIGLVYCRLVRWAIAPAHPAKHAPLRVLLEQAIGLANASVAAAGGAFAEATCAIDNEELTAAALDRAELLMAQAIKRTLLAARVAALVQRQQQRSGMTSLGDDADEEASSSTQF